MTNYDEVQKKTVLNFISNENTRYNNNITPTLHVQDEFDVALENIILNQK